jgi:DNA end-binding protein Ku
MVGMLLRYPYEVRNEAEYFDSIQDVKVTQEMLDLAKHIVDQKSGSFDPDKFEDRYETALSDLLKQKQAGQPIKAAKHETPSNVVNLMDALRKSLGGGEALSKPAGKSSPQAKPRPKAKKPASKRRAG